MKIKPTIQTPAVTLTSPDDFQQLLDRALDLAKIGGDEADAIEVAAVSEQEIIRMNRQYLGHDRVTDVIAFDLRENSTPEMPDEEEDDETINIVGEIAVCPESALKVCAEFKTTAEYEFVLYIVHGLLHIVGYDDLTPTDRATMKKRESEIMETLTGEFNIEQILHLKS
jgi:probable rRNA maturation factor